MARSWKVGGLCRGDDSMVPFIHCLVAADGKVTESLFGDRAFDKRPCEVVDQAVTYLGWGWCVCVWGAPSMQRP